MHKSLKTEIKKTVAARPKGGGCLGGINLKNAQRGGGGYPQALLKLQVYHVACVLSDGDLNE